MRYAAQVEYEGSVFHGWQRQTHASSVQSELEAALSRVADHSISVVCAGRTDAGVHGVGQTVHFDSDADRPLRAWTLGANSFLPRQVAVRSVHPVSDDFHARYSALDRSYRYIVLNTDTRSALLDKRALWVHQTLNIEAMRMGAQHLHGEHDFSAFRASGCQAKSPWREIKQLAIHCKYPLVYLDITANAFLHNMVRIIVGSLLQVAKGDLSSTWIREVLESRVRSGVTAPAHGLYFIGPSYPETFGLPRIDELSLNSALGESLVQLKPA